MSAWPGKLGAAFLVVAAVAAPCAAEPAPATQPVQVISDAPDKVVVDANTQQVIDGALKWLAAQQNLNGSWSGNGQAHPIAVTGYVVMAYLACGNLPNSGTYARPVTNGVGYLLGTVGDNGYISSQGPRGGNKESNMYDHAIAAMALGEVYGQTQDPLIRPKLAAAIRLIVGCQSESGGWRYNPRPEDADISSTVLQLVALRCAKNAGLNVPQATIDRAVEFIRSCYDPPSGGFTYQPHNHAPGFARTADAI